MPVYNCEAFVSDAIQSILDQTFKDFELIVIDDHSTDNTLSEIKKHKDPRIQIVEKKENSGLITSLNLGIRLSRGEFIARMDGDDICNIKRFEKQINYLKTNADVVLCGAWYQRHSTNEIIRFPLTHEDIKFALLDYCPICHPTIMVRTHFLKDNQLTYDLDFKAAEDYELWTRVVSLGKVANLPEVLIDYRTHENQVSKAFNAQQSINSYRCMAKMMCTVIDAPSAYDEDMSLAVVQGEAIKSVERLKEVIRWLDRLIMTNNSTRFYSQTSFKRNISNRKFYICRRFYLSTSPHNPKILFEALNNGLLRSLKFTEFLKYAVKCVFFLK